MKDEPDIIKELREAEKLGLLHSMVQSTFEESEAPDESIDKTSNQTNYMIEPREKRTKEDELGSVEEKYRTIFENYTVAITLADNKERIVSWNKYTEELLNMTQNELYLKSVNSLYPPEEWQKIRAENVRQKGIKYRMETRMIKKNQGCFDVELTLCVLRGKEGKTVGSVGIIKDISKLKETERELKASEERYRTIYENSAVAIMLTDEKERIISWNKFTENLLGIGKEDLYLKPVESLYPVEEWQKIRSENIRQKGLQHHMETKIFKKNNKIIDVDLSLSILKNHEGKVVGSIGVIQDITECKQIQKTLQESEQKYRNLVDRAKDGIAIIQDNKVEFLNQGAARMLGYTVDEIHGTEFFKYIAPEVRKMLIQRYEDKMAGKKTPDIYESLLLKKDEKTIPVEINTCIINYNGRSADFAIVRDITERKKAEEKIQYQADLLNNVSDAIISTDIDFKIKSWNKAAEQIYGWKEEELLGKLGEDVTKLSFPNGSKKDIVKQVLKNGKWDGEVLQRHKNGKILNIYASVTLIKDSEGKPIGAVAVNRDITDRKKAEEELQENKEKFSNLAELLPEIVFEMDYQGILSFVNKQSFKITGYSEEDFKKGFQAINFLIPEDRERAMQNIRRAMNGEKINPQEYTAQRKDGTIFPIIVYSSPILKDGQPVGLRGIIVDISARKKIESELRDAHEILKTMNKELEEKVKERTVQVEKLLKQKDAFINQLGHDLKNPLNPIVNLLPLVGEREQDSKSKENLRVIIRNVDFMKNLVVKTVELAQLNSPNVGFYFEDINLLERINDVIEKNKLMIDENHMKIKSKIGENIIIRADKLRLEELFGNLIDNAIKYSPNGGNVTIDAKEDEEFVTVSVKDTGLGINKNQIEFIFNEFYKTDHSRHDFKSSGLGLPICKRIVEKHGGRIWAESSGKDKGSTFYFTVPKGCRIISENIPDEIDNVLSNIEEKKGET